MAPKKLKKLSKENAAYLAGLIDGEGTITLTNKQKGAERQLVVSISNTEYDLLESVFKMTGVWKITSKRSTNQAHRTGHTFVLSNRQALELLSRMLPYLHSYKKQRAKLVIKNYIRLTPRNGKYTPALLAKREKFVKKFFEMKFSLQKQKISTKG
ncbi:MAG: hypothetical protein A3D65_01100 [Candidatus Lloydbacteria bacterium RIFCSPHIGHO2_02_FULL_50_13]|uniref:Homing endonuclease LAGLIDADG domain-containing protein n=1 Tax=Candidatus Lloydbacteria bacterium RIFCSPHIGHO2_02_FULL_50_13 TaxID=1798661 RepID=A0A1G2D4C2_9BACT|nr:MAG: hypothetical protein A3D65_01100 [Candidatus Lloydbacteria bacterium RIFCSPHIGHO2_02_FULL_50_13]